jgi:predicted Zn finger-like uncharacterized protein
MIITCGECDSSFILDDSLVKSSGSKVRCSNCKNVFVAYPAKTAVEPELKKSAVTKKAVEDFDGIEESYDYENDPDLSKAVEAIDEKDLEFTDEELGITSLMEKRPPVVQAVEVPKPEVKIPVPEPVPAPVIADTEKSLSDEEDILDFADFEMEMDDGEDIVPAVSHNDEDLDLNLDDDMDVSPNDDDLELDLMPDSDEEEDLDFSDLELELDGKMNDTEMIGSMTPDEMDSADTVVVEELQLDLSDDDSIAPPPLPGEDDFSFGEKESDTAMMVDDELDFSDLERELDGISDEPASVDELDLGLDTDEEAVESETIMMDGDELDFSEFEFDDDEGKASDKKAKKEAQDAEDELDFSNLASILDSEPPPQDNSKESDEDLDLELDLDLDGDGDSGKSSSMDDEEEELDFSDLEDLLDDLEKADAAAKNRTPEDINLELDVALDEEVELPVSGKDSALSHDEEDLDFSDVEAMLDLDEGGIEEKLGFEGSSSSELELEMEMENSDSKNFIKIGDEEDPDIELELDMGDDEKEEDEENELLELEEDDDDDDVLATGQDSSKKALADKADSKKKAKAKPKRKAPGRGKDILKYVVYGLIVLFILFFLYMSKNAIGQAIGVNIPVNIAPLEQLRDSISKMGIPVLSSFVAPQDKDAQGKFNLKTSGITGKIIPNSKLGDLFVITGNVQNMYPETRNSISLVCKLFGRGGSVSQTELFYAGNVIPEAQLLKMDAAMIKKRIQNRLGDNNINTKVRPNQVVPFMVIFTRLGDNLTEFSVEPAGSMPGSTMP